MRLRAGYHRCPRARSLARGGSVARHDTVLCPAGCSATKHLAHFESTTGRLWCAGHLAGAEPQPLDTPSIGIFTASRGAELGGLDGGRLGSDQSYGPPMGDSGTRRVHQFSARDPSCARADMADVSVGHRRHRSPGRTEFQGLSDGPPAGSLRIVTDGARLRRHRLGLRLRVGSVHGPRLSVFALDGLDGRSCLGGSVVADAEPLCHHGGAHGRSVDPIRRTQTLVLVPGKRTRPGAAHGKKGRSWPARGGRVKWRVGEMRYLLYFLIGGAVVSLTTWFVSLGRSWVAAFVSTFPALTVLTFILIYWNGGVAETVPY